MRLRQYTSLGTRIGDWQLAAIGKTVTTAQSSAANPLLYNIYSGVYISIKIYIFKTHLKCLRAMEVIINHRVSPNPLRSGDSVDIVVVINNI